MNSDPHLEVVCLGTGIAGDHVYHGRCSTAYVLTINKAPFLLIGCGSGVVKQCLEYFGSIPHTVFVPNNRSHWAAELPVLLTLEAQKQHHLRVVAEGAVMFRLMDKRLAELHDGMRSSGMKIDDIGTFIHLSAPTTGASSTDSSSGDFNLLRDNAVNSPTAFTELLPGVYLSVVGPAKSLERSYGVRISAGDKFENSQPLLCIGCDSAFDEGFYGQLSANCPAVIVDARANRTNEHATFGDVDRYSRSLKRTEQNPGSVFVISQYGADGEPPAPSHGISHVQSAAEGNAITIFPSSTLQTEAHTKVERALNEAALLIATSALDHLNRSNPPVEKKPKEPEEKKQTPVHVPPVPITRWAGAPSVNPGKSGSSSPHRSAGNRSGGYQKFGEERTTRSKNFPPPSPSTPAHQTIGAAQPRHSDPRRLATIATHAWANKIKAENKPPTPRRDSRGSSPVARSGSPQRWEGKRAYVYNNEEFYDREHLMMVHQFYRVGQIKDKCADVLGILPVADLVLVKENQVIETLDQIEDEAMIVVTKHGGKPYDPRQLPYFAQQRLQRSGSPSPRRRGPPTDVPNMPKPGPVPKPTSSKKRTPSAGRRSTTPSQGKRRGPGHSPTLADIIGAT